ncbi:urocortin [Ambystoma mexicanum]|uniref:urocortin n=1 Tax=Ambystoma mexicanum TaxID=8296 RepID=UPI0037E70307
MKTTVVTLLAAYVLLLAHITPITCRPMERNSYDGSAVSLNRVLNEESAQALLYFLREKLNPNLDWDPRVLVSLSRVAPERLPPDYHMSLKELSRLLGNLQPLFQGTGSSAEEATRSSWEEFSDRLKREDPPISIDLTFHILRQMIEIAKTQSQKQQAEQNRIILDSVGK